jgi:hypothetical protein
MTTPELPLYACSAVAFLLIVVTLPGVVIYEWEKQRLWSTSITVAHVQNVLAAIMLMEFAAGCILVVA